MFASTMTLRCAFRESCGPQITPKIETQWKIINHLVKNHPRSRWKLIKDSSGFTSMNAKAIAKWKSATVVGIVFGDDEKAANPSCMTFDEFILRHTKPLRRHTVAVCRMKTLCPFIFIARRKDAFYVTQVTDAPWLIMGYPINNAIS